MKQKPDKRQVIEITIEVIIVLIVCGLVGFFTYDKLIKKEAAKNPTIQEMQTTTNTNIEIEQSEPELEVEEITDIETEAPVENTAEETTGTVESATEETTEN